METSEFVKLAIADGSSSALFIARERTHNRYDAARLKVSQMLDAIINAEQSIRWSDDATETERLSNWAALLRQRYAELAEEAIAAQFRWAANIAALDEAEGKTR